MADHRSVDVGGIRLAYEVSGPPDSPPLAFTDVVAAFLPTGKNARHARRP